MTAPLSTFSFWLTLLILLFSLDDDITVDDASSSAEGESNHKAPHG